MNKLIGLTLLLLSLTVTAQEPPKMPKYVAKNAANIFYYDLVETPKKIKVKKKKQKGIVVNALKAYNDKVKKIAFLNGPKLAELELTVNSLGPKIYKDRDVAQNIRKKIESTVLPVRDSIAIYEKVLDSTFNKILSKKQLRKWTKFKRAQKRKLLPERPKSNRGAAPPSNMNRRGGRGMGMGGRRF